mmetsp:Transcript_24214/g.60140  ORF Transcript_24214/g.60140 Transcript_24214/m.60140 type:complete len:251 (-) Transcript_24214:480-1232(-)
MPSNASTMLRRASSSPWRAGVAASASSTTAIVAFILAQLPSSIGHSSNAKGPENGGRCLSCLPWALDTAATALWQSKPCCRMVAAKAAGVMPLPCRLDELRAWRNNRLQVRAVTSVVAGWLVADSSASWSANWSADCAADAARTTALNSSYVNTPSPFTSASENILPRSWAATSDARSQCRTTRLTATSRSILYPPSALAAAAALTPVANTWVSRRGQEASMARVTISTGKRLWPPLSSESPRPPVRRKS